MTKCPDCDGPAHGQHQAHWFKSSSAPAAVANAPSKQVRVVANKQSVGVNRRKLVLTGVNASGVNRSADRHKPGYMRDWMRAHRKARA